MSQRLVEELIDRYLTAYSASDARACAETFTADGRLYSPYGPTAEGREAIAATHLEWFDEPEDDKRLDLEEFEQHGNVGHCLLSWSAKVPDEDDPDSLTRAGGVSLAILSLDEDRAYFSQLALVPDSI